MLLHSGIINLDYNPASDVLVTSLPDIKQFSLSEADFCFGLIVQSIREYDIKKLLLDSSNSVIEVDDEAYKSIAAKFAMNLMGTRLERLARVGTADAVREEKSAKVSADVRQELTLPMEFRNFTSRGEAMDWLLS